MRLSVCTITAREQPRYEWLIRDLAAQMDDGDEIEVLIIDALTLARDLDLGRVPPGIEVRICAPKPTPYQGPHRVTSRDLHAIANARNTALCLASFDYVAFVDDRVRLGVHWLHEVRKAQERRASAVCGPCHKDMLGVGRVTDDRADRAPLGRVNCGGDWFYGGNFALPLDWALEINGCEEGTDPVGRQDRVMGHMLHNRGRRIDYLEGMSVLLDRKLAKPHPFPRIGKGVPPGDKGRAIMARFAKRDRTELTPDLGAMRSALLAGDWFPPHGATAQDPDWFDGRPIGEM